MIKINLTLFVQMINVFITYHILSRVVLIPLIHRIINRRKNEKCLRDEIVLKERDLDRFLSEKTSHLSQFSRDASQECPLDHVRTKKTVVPAPHDHVKELSEKEYQSLKHKIGKRLYDVASK